MVCRQLNRHELAQCAQVNKKWRKAVIPFLWHDIKWVWCGARGKAFRKMVLANYLHEQRNQTLQHIHAGRSYTSPLAEFGQWIRFLPGPKNLLSCLHPTHDSTQPQQALLQQNKEPAALDLLCHLYKHCPAIQIQYLTLTVEDLKSDDILRAMSEAVVPIVRHLCIGHSSRRKHMEAWRLKYLLSRCSNVLEKLTLDVKISYSNSKWDEQEEDPTTWPQLKELNMNRCFNRSKPTRFWSWLWGRCTHVERLAVGEVDWKVIQSLANNMRTQMPNLTKIQLGVDDRYARRLTNSEVAALFAGSRNGWRAVEMKQTVGSWDGSMATLANHYPTLESLTVDGCGRFSGHDLAQVLSFSPNLHTLVAIDDGSYSVGMFPFIKGGIFADQDPFTGYLKTWACETSLKVLKIKITDIPIAIQKRVYERLARLTNLEILWLGHYPNLKYRCKEIQQPQDSCMTMSLESGLHELSRLMDLKELNVSGMMTKIDPKEVQWMIKYWPRLRVLRGLEKDEDHGALEWLQKHCPDIDTKKRWQLAW
ncbi:MAG: hypothetical protein J3Q66DRAFT_395573 [Benniella sp.]|nr:MAG: hypothetical protein J3Q66DRAFT_395573 [Benniella sp.]